MMRAVLVGGALALVACAHSGGAKECDPSTDTCACGPGQPDCPTGSTCDTTQMVCVESPDANLNTTPDADLSPDAKPTNGFGQPCLDRQDCTSDICILTSTGGVCSELCGTCPDGWGCFGVLGAVDPNEVSNVCVPVTTQLCSPCTMDTECAQIGMDKCVTETTGRSYCARDCTNVSCPTGYDCDQVTISGTDYKECMPHSAACDCNTATQQGATDPCSITTGFGTTCGGTSTCGGTAGWGACTPPSSTDDPDGTYTDDNCDGIDGDITKGIFVASAGADTAACGLVHTMPCATISFGIIRAVQAGKQNVYVQAGNYNEVVVLLSGVNVWGGYDFNWQRASYSTPGHTVTITGKQDTSTGGDSEWITVRAHNLIVPVTMGDLVIQGPAAQGTGGSSGLDGRSSYAVHVNAASLTLVRVQVKGGNGAPGATGGAGADAVIVDAQGYMSGGNGGNGFEAGDICNDSTRGGPGPHGTNSCSASPSSRLMNGGDGGQGGTEDSSCPFSLNATAGANGSTAAYVQGGFGAAGSGGSGSGNCGATTPGGAGIIVNGGGGGVNNGAYVIGNGYWYARAGNGGTTGENGSGGGGGGGAGGCDNGADSYGGGGGGGGAGGCAARGGGGGGGGGGGSFAVFVTGSSTVNASSCDVVLGVAGTGGAGGTGGRGQSGGGAGAGGARANNGSAPGNGGAGAHGGHGGGGGGGQGGRSVGVGWTPGSTVNQSCSFSGGAQGFGGSGGAAAPNAPAAERDGNNGGNGGGGTVDQTRQCNSTGDC